MDRYELLPVCVCGSDKATADVINEIPVLVCASCGITRQSLFLTPMEVAQWYKEKYHDGAYYHTYEQDKGVADLRLKAYAFEPGAKVLDVGCGNSAFVNQARAQGFDAWGQDLASQSDGPHTYVGPLEDIAFPTESFDAVTMHDVLEHFPDPKRALLEIARVLRPNGRLIVDYPRFFHERGRHHWKPVEHLWMFREAELSGLLTQVGFNVTKIYYPIASKFVIWAERVPVKRPQILVPSGIGDTYWVLTKLPGFLREKGLGLPDILVQDQLKGLKRTEPFVQTIPFVRSAGYKVLPPTHPVFHEAYMKNGRTVFTNVLDVDYFIAYNGVMRFGRSLEEVDRQYGCEWFPKMHFSKAVQNYQAMLEEGGPYAVVYLVHHGMYSKWIAEFSFSQLEETIKAIESQLGLRIVMIGATWDKASLGDRLAQANPRWVNLVGDTSYEEMLGALRGASLIFGYPSGATILGPVLRRPTVLCWNKYFHRNFWLNVAPPETPYCVLDTEGLTPGDVLGSARAAMGL